MTCPHCQQRADFHSHRTHRPTRLLGPIRSERAYYLCRRCGTGCFPFDAQAGLSARQRTPALERVVAWAGLVADRFEKSAALVHEMVGTRLSASTVERTTAEAGQRLAQQLPAGQTFGPKIVWPWHKDYQGRSCAYIERDATGVRQQGPGDAAAEGRMASVGLVGNPTPAWPGPEEKPTPMHARYLAGLSPLEEVGPLLRRQAAQGGMDQAAGWLGVTDGGNGLEDRLAENFPLVWAVILDCYHPAERLFGLARRRHPSDEARAEEQGRNWCRLLKEEGGALRAAVLREGDWPAGRPGLAEAVAEVGGYVERQAHRMEYPE